MLMAQNLVASVFQKEAIDPVLPLCCTRDNASLASLLMIESPTTFSHQACSRSPHIPTGSKYSNTAVHANEGVSVVLNKPSDSNPHYAVFQSNVSSHRDNLNIS